MAAITSGRKKHRASVHMSDLVQLPPEEDRKKEGMVEKRTPTSAGVWHRRRLVLTQERLCIAREESQDVLDQIPLTSILVVSSAKPSQSFFRGSGPSEGSMSPFNRKPESSLPDGPRDENAPTPNQRPEAKMFCFEVSTQTDSNQRGRTYVSNAINPRWNILLMESRVRRGCTWF